jgi:hypothetical protein
MHKVIVERPRRKGLGAYRRSRGGRRRELAELPGKEGIRKSYRNRGTDKELNENLAPLKRYLRKQIGRPWNSVYRDISAGLHTGSAVQQHVRDHIWDFVAEHVTLGERGAVLRPPGNRWFGSTPLRPGALYIHPRTGLLLAVKRKKGSK